MRWGWLNGWPNGGWGYKEKEGPLCDMDGASWMCMAEWVEGRAERGEALRWVGIEGWGSLRWVYLNGWPNGG